MWFIGLFWVYQWTVSMTVLIGPNWESTRLWLLSTWQRDGDITSLWKLPLTFLQPALWLQHCSKLAERERDMTSLWKLILGTAHFVATNWKKSRPYGLISKSNSVWSTKAIVLLRGPMVDCPTQPIFMISYLYLSVFHDKYQSCKYEKHSRVIQDTMNQIFWQFSDQLSHEGDKGC